MSQAYRTIFPVTQVDPTAAARIATKAELSTVIAPKYATEAEVTVAVAKNEIPFTEINRSYRLAKEYQLYLKAIEREANKGRKKKYGPPIRIDKPLNFTAGFARVDFSPAKG